MSDLISRSALLVVPNVNKVTEYDEAGFGMSYNAVSVETIENAPAVDAEVVRHGRWGRFGKTHHRIVCSVCKHPTPFKKQANGYHLAWKSNYCLNCGVKMEQEDN